MKNKIIPIIMIVSLLFFTPGIFNKNYAQIPEIQRSIESQESKKNLKYR